MEDGFPNRKQGSKDREGCALHRVRSPTGRSVVPNGVSECLGASCFSFVCFAVKKFYHFHAVNSRCHIYGRFKHFLKVRIKIFSSTFNKKQHKYFFFFGVFCLLRLASVCPSVSLPFRVSFIFIRAFENFHTDSFKGDESVPSDM